LSIDEGEAADSSASAPPATHSSARFTAYTRGFICCGSCADFSRFTARWRSGAFDFGFERLRVGVIPGAFGNSKRTVALFFSWPLRRREPLRLVMQTRGRWTSDKLGGAAAASASSSAALFFAA